jgi:hypothetical protein
MRPVTFARLHCGSFRQVQRLGRLISDQLQWPCFTCTLPSTLQTSVWCLGARLTLCLFRTIDFLHVALFRAPYLAYLYLRHLLLGLASADISSSPLRLRNSTSPAFDDQHIAITPHSH